MEAMKKLLAILILVLALATVPTLIAFSRQPNQTSRGSTNLSDNHSGSNGIGSGDLSNLSEENRFESGLVGIQTPNVTVRSVPGAGRPWIVASGEAKLESERLEVEVQGLLLTNTGNSTLDGTTGPVTGVRASLTCEGSNVVATTAVVSLSSTGNARIEQELKLPSSCIGPVILIRVGSTVTNPGPIMGPWIAATGF